METLKGKKILVTGGAGFIGSHIVDRLAPDNDVTVLDDLSHGTPDNLLNSRDRIEFVHGDILDRALVNQLVSKTDYVFHLAALTSVIRSLKEPEAYIKTNIDGTFNLLEACRAARIKRFVFSSSAAVFGDAQYIPVDENHPLNPKSPYAVTKLAGEKLITAYHHSYGLPGVALRYFNIYGPRQDTSEYGNVISIFFRKFKAHQPVTVYGDGEQTRDLIYVQDVVAANLLAAVSPNAPGEVFNIATGEAPTINHLINSIRKVSGWEGQVNYAPERAGEIKHSRANITKAKELLGYQPGVALEQGLSLTWETLK
jgi:UDP-glucose 4-epimerase